MKIKLRIHIHSRFKKRLLKFWKTSVLPTMLCGCSVLGSRQDEAKINIDESVISQLEIAPEKEGEKKSSLSKGELRTDETKVYAYAQTLHPDMSWEEIVDHGVGISEEEFLTDLETGNIDTAVVWSTGGGGIRSNMDAVFNASDKEFPAISALRTSLLNEYSDCEGRVQTIQATGTMTISLDEFQVGQLAENAGGADILEAMIETSDGEPVNVTEAVFGDLPDETQGQIIEYLFNPNIQELTRVAKMGIVFCRLESDPDRYAIYTTDGLSDGRIDPESIVVDGKKITFTREQIVEKSFLDAIQFTSPEDEGEIPLTTVRVGRDDNVKQVFSRPNYLWVEKVTFYLDLDADLTEAEEPETVQTQPATAEEAPPTIDGEDPGDEPLEFTEPDAVVDSPEIEEPRAEDAPEPVVAEAPVVNAAVARVEPRAEEAPEEPVAAPLHPVFAKFLSNDLPYTKVNVGTSTQKNPSIYKTNAYVSDSEVSSQCGRYKFKRDFDSVTATINNAHMKPKAKYYEWALPQIKRYIYSLGGLASFLPTDAKDAVSKDLLAALHATPSNVKIQNWKLKVCFDEQGFVSFLSTEDSRNLFSKDEDGTIRKTKKSSTDKTWLVAAQNKQRGSKLSIKCEDETSEKCEVHVQAHFKRKIAPAATLAYFDSSKILPTLPYSLFSGRVWQGLYDTFKGKGGLQNEIAVKFHFDFDPDQDYASQRLEKQEGKLASVHFPGEDLNFIRLNIY